MIPPRTRQKRTLSQPHDTILECACVYGEWVHVSQSQHTSWLVKSMALLYWIETSKFVVCRASAHLLSSKAVILILSMLASVWALARTLTSPLVQPVRYSTGSSRGRPSQHHTVPHQSERSWMADGYNVCGCGCPSL